MGLERTSEQLEQGILSWDLWLVFFLCRRTFFDFGPMGNSVDVTPSHPSTHGRDTPFSRHPYAPRLSFLARSCKKAPFFRRSRWCRYVSTLSVETRWKRALHANSTASDSPSSLVRTPDGILPSRHAIERHGGRPFPPSSDAGEGHGRALKVFISFFFSYNAVSR